MVPQALCAVLALAAPEGAEETAPSWITFDVLNPDEVGRHRILHLEDLLRLRKVEVGDLPSARAVLVVAVALDDCARADGLCTKLAPLAEEARPLGGLIVAVLMESTQNLARARNEISAKRRPFVIAQDGHGITRHALRLVRSGDMIVINSVGRFVRFSQPSETPKDLDRKLDEVSKGFRQALARDKEDEQ